MAESTPLTLRSSVMYQIFVRNFSPEGTFAAVRGRLDEIRELGTDIVWLMPIHPIGEAQRKGTLGSPYAIRDYRAVNPEFGTLEDFKALVDDIHAHGMKCIIDVVYNHTSPDSVLRYEHPEWFYHREDGSFGNRVGDWSDIIDLDYANEGLWDYQIGTLKMWAEIVDGFRCDVAPLIPIAFWQRARAEVEQVRPGCIWLSEESTGLTCILPPDKTNADYFYPQPNRKGDWSNFVRMVTYTGGNRVLLSTRDNMLYELNPTSWQSATATTLPAAEPRPGPTATSWVLA